MATNGVITFSQKRARQEETDQTEAMLLPKKKKPRRDPLEIDTVEGKRSKGKIVTNFERQSKNSAIGLIKSIISFDETLETDSTCIKEEEEAILAEVVEEDEAIEVEAIQLEEIQSVLLVGTKVTIKFC